MAANRTCRTCRHFMPVHPGAANGVCTWEPPPFVEQMIDALNAEPATQINWKATFALPPTTSADKTCSGHAPTDAAARIGRLL